MSGREKKKRGRKTDNEWLRGENFLGEVTRVGRFSKRKGGREKKVNRENSG